MRTIDWSQNHWNYGRREPCHLCGQPSMLTDDARRPAHKACVEHAAGLREHDPQSGHFPKTSETLTTTADPLIAMVIDTMGPGTQVVKEPRPRTFGLYAKLRDPEPELGVQVELGFQLESFEVLAFVGPAGCPECGDPLDGPALIKRCQPKHKWRQHDQVHSGRVDARTPRLGRERGERTHCSDPGTSELWISDRSRDAPESAQAA